MSETKKMANGENVIFYNNDLEQLLAQSAEECESLGILHLASYEKYNKLSNIINIPVIILSSGIGFITGIDLNYDRMNIILGIGSVFVGIIKSIDSYFQLGKRAESHRMCALQYTQINKKIQIELSLCREQRQTAKDMLSIIKTDIKNLQDISPVIDQEIIKEYNLKYGKYKNVKKPNFVNGLSSVKVNANSLEQELAAARSIPQSIQSGAPSRAMSVTGLGQNQHQNMNLNMNDVAVNIPFQTFGYDNNMSGINLNPKTNYSAGMQTPSKPSQSNSNSVSASALASASASAQLVYANSRPSSRPGSRPISRPQSIQNSRSYSIQNSRPVSLTQTPVSSSPISSFRLHDTNEQQPQQQQRQEQQQQEYSNVIDELPASHLSTPQLLHSFQQPNQPEFQEEQEQQSEVAENGNEMNLVIDIPDLDNMNMNHGDGNDSPSSPTGSQVGNM